MIAWPASATRPAARAAGWRRWRPPSSRWISLSSAFGLAVSPLRAERELIALDVEGPKRLPGIPFHYDPLPVLRNLDTPQPWVLGGDDLVAPAPETARRLAALAAAGRPITAAVYPGADHGLYYYETDAAGGRVSTRAPAGYFPMMWDFIVERRLEGDYGAEIVSRGAQGVP